MFLFYCEITNYKLDIKEIINIGESSFFYKLNENLKNIENLKFLSIKFLYYQLQLLIIYHFCKSAGKC